MGSAKLDEVPIDQALQELDIELLGVIRRAIARQTTSYSSHESIITGNAYQSVDLRGHIQAGFRAPHTNLFAGIPLEGKRFIDLGCNYGETTRLAALAGAEYAEGVDCEEYFVRIGGLLSTYNRVFNAVIRQGDITQPGIVKTDFDIGACFSAFIYLRKNLDDVLARIRSMFILETHAMEADWYDQYVVPIVGLFPNWILYAFSDHGHGFRTLRRAQLAFTHEHEMAVMVAINRAEALGIECQDVYHLDLAKSRRADTLMGDEAGSRLLFQELRGFIKALGAGSHDELRQLLRKTILQLGEMQRISNHKKSHFGTDRYWQVLFEGIVHYIETLGMDSTNPYLSYMRELVSRGAYDSGMTYELETDDRAIARLGPRLVRIMDTLLTKQIPNPLVVFNPLSVPLLLAHGYTPDDRQLKEHIEIKGRGEFRLQRIDGNHRLAAMWLSGAASCPILPTWTNIFGLDAPKFSLFKDSEKQNQIVVPLLAKTVLFF